MWFVCFLKQWIYLQWCGFREMIDSFVNDMECLFFSKTPQSQESHHSHTTNNPTQMPHNLLHRQRLIPRHLLKDNLRHATTHSPRPPTRVRKRLRQGRVALHLHSAQLPRLRCGVEGNAPHQTPHERVVVHRWNRRLQHHESLQRPQRAVLVEQLR